MSELIYSDALGDLAASQRMDEGVEVNGELISGEEINREMQYHPAESMDQARENAARALTIRLLLLREAERLQIETKAMADEAEEEARVRCLIEKMVETPEPDKESCRRFFDKNREQFRSPDEYKVSHILLAAAPDDDRARDQAEQQAREMAELVIADPLRFPELAGRFSACPSREQGGSLGKICRGQTVPEFERALALMTPGTIRRTPLPTRYGYHVVYLESRIDGRLLDFEEAYPLASDYLRESVYRRSLTQYIQLLAGNSVIKGIDLQASDTPLVQ